MKVETYRCDGCGKMKSDDSNHWFCVERFKTRALCVEPLEDVVGDPGSTAKHSELHTYCGRACVQKEIERYLQETTSA